MFSGYDDNFRNSVISYIQLKDNPFKKLPFINSGWFDSTTPDNKNIF